jgi:hypothetical protein
MATTSTLREVITAEAAARRCDLCRDEPGVSWVDHFWACAGCVRRYLEKLEMERCGI